MQLRLHVHYSFIEDLDKGIDAVACLVLHITRHDSRDSGDLNVMKLNSCSLGAQAQVDGLWARAESVYESGRWEPVSKACTTQAG